MRHFVLRVKVKQFFRKLVVYYSDSLLFLNKFVQTQLQMKIQNIVNYYRDCYVADNRDLSIWDFFASKVQHSTILSGKEELISGDMPYLPMNEEAAAKIQKILQLYNKEKELIYCAFFIIGNRENDGEEAQKVCAPLFTYPAKIINQGELFYIQIDISGRRINYSVLNSLRENPTQEDNFYETLYNEMPRNEIDENNVANVSMVLKKYLPNLDTTAIVEFPEVVDEKKIKRMLQAKQTDDSQNFTLIPASAYGLIDKSNDTLGVINELTAMGKDTIHSQPIKALFEGWQSAEKQTIEIGRVPAILSSAQQTIMQSAEEFPFTLVVGPPGTGKTYTIASLAIEHISKGKSVLIASRTDQAVDVVANKIESQLGIKGVIIRGGRSSYLRELKKDLKNLLSGINAHTQSTPSKMNELLRQLKRLDTQVAKLEKEFTERAEKEMEWGKYWVDKKHDSSFFSTIKKRYITWQNNRHTPHWQLIVNIENLLTQQLASTKKYIETAFGVQVNRTLEKHRADLNNFLKGISTHSGTTQEMLFGKTDMQKILKTFPVWLVKMSDIYKVLPLDTELFDIAIIDEATQCDIASCLPILQRAKRAMFAGDPNQLRHVSFLSGSRQDILQKKYQLSAEFEGNFPHDLLNYREKSILDVVGDRASSQKQVIFLEEHYRSTPQIIQFSNKMFYSNALRVMTSKPNLSVTEGIHLVDCKGERNKQGYNPKEAEYVIDTLKKIVESQQNLSREVAKSIGILSPFRAQADYISKLIDREFTLEVLEKHNINVGTAYSFQGEERDIMFISFALDGLAHASAYFHLNKADVFNVSVTRARSELYLLYSVEIEKLKTDSLFRKYLETYLTAQKSTEIPTKNSHDEFMTEINTMLAEHQLPYWEAYPVAGLQIDIVFLYKNKAYGIDLIGFTGEYEEAFSLERYKMLQRAGIRIFPMPYTYWQANRQQCISELFLWLESK